MSEYYDAAAGDWVCSECGLCTDHCRCHEVVAECVLDLPLEIVDVLPE